MFSFEGGGGLFKAKIEPLTAKIELYRAEIQLLVLCSAKIQLFSATAHSQAQYFFPWIVSLPPIGVIEYQPYMFSSLWDHTW